MKCYLIISASGNGFYNFFLKKKFKHCLICFESNNQWTFIDPLQNKIKITKFKSLAKRKLIHRITKLGCLVAELNYTKFNIKIIKDLTTYNPKNSHNLKKIDELQTSVNCVQIIKEILNLTKIYLQTPWQLYSYLDKNNKIIAKYHHSIYQKCI